MPDWKPGDPLPEAQNAQIDPKKFDEYSMNPENPQQKKMKTKVKPQIYDGVKTSVVVQADFSERDIPKGTVRTIVECYEDPEGYAVDLAISDQKFVGGFDYENVILKPNQFEVIRVASKEPLLRKVKELKGTPIKEMARALGFVSYTKTGQERVKLASFMNALLEAKGVGFGGSSGRDW